VRVATVTALCLGAHVVVTVPDGAVVVVQQVVASHDVDVVVVVSGLSSFLAAAMLGTATEPNRRPVVTPTTSPRCLIRFTGVSVADGFGMEEMVGDQQWLRNCSAARFPSQRDRVSYLPGKG
jgi:hypothetical protein